MQIKGLLRAVALGIVITAPAGAHASFSQTSDVAGFNLNHSHSDDNGGWNGSSSLTSGDYTFADYHRPGKSFFDQWSFSLAETSDVVVSLFDLLIPNSGSDNLLPQRNGFSHKFEHSETKNLTKSLLDNKYLTVSLFDGQGNLLGTTGENGTLSAFHLAGGEWYTLGVSGKAVGLVGGLYYGNLNVQSAPAVPIGDTLPLFASALVVLGLRSKKIRRHLSIK